MERIALSPVIYRSLFLSLKGGLSIPRISKKSLSPLSGLSCKFKGTLTFSSFPVFKWQSSKPKQTTTNLLPYHLPENTNAYQFMQVENRSVHQPTSPSVDSEIHPDIIQGALLSFLDIRKLNLSVITMLGFQGYYYGLRLCPHKFIHCSPNPGVSEYDSVGDKVFKELIMLKRWMLNMLKRWFAQDLLILLGGP